MPDKRKHRGPSPQDAIIFGEKNLPSLRSAVADMSLLLGKGYAQRSTLKYVGDRFGLTGRQRLAVLRCSCSDQQLEMRKGKEVDCRVIEGSELLLDGFNILITVEAMLSGAAIFVGRDGCWRDLSGIHGSYRRVSETTEAFHLIAGVLEKLGVRNVAWMLDSPVSNSGRLKKMIAGLADENGWPWQVELDFNPDKILVSTDKIIATSDSDVLDKCGRWLNLAPMVGELFKQERGGQVNLIDMGSSNNCF